MYYISILQYLKNSSVLFYIAGDEIEHVNTICLPFGYVDGRTWAGKNMVVAGWGYTQANRFMGGRSDQIRINRLGARCYISN